MAAVENPMTKKDDLSKCFLNLIDTYIAGDPMNETIRWTHLSPRRIRDLMLEKHHQKTSIPTVRNLLRDHGLRRRKAQKNVTMGNVPNRNEQFENIASLRQLSASSFS